MKIVHVEGFFHANAGYQVNILPKYLRQLGHEQYILTSELDLIPEELTSFFGRHNIEESDEDYEKKNDVKIIRLPLKKYISGREIFSEKLYEQIEELKPDVLFVHGNDSYTGIQLIRKFSKKKDYFLITDSHMLETASRNKLSFLFQFYYRKFITPKIIKNNIIVIRTQNDSYVEKKLSIPLSQAPWVPTGSDLMLFHPNEKVKSSFRAKNQINDDAFVVVYTGKLDASKGGMLLAESFKEKFNTNKEVVLMCVGNTVGDFGAKVEEVFNQSENRIIRIPTQTYNNLAKFYQCSDISIFPKQSSLSFYDAQACGLPALLENKSINIERVSHENGITFEANDIVDLRKKIEFFAEMNSDELKRYSNNALQLVKRQFNYESVAKEYEKVIMDSYKNFKGLV